MGLGHHVMRASFALSLLVGPMGFIPAFAAQKNTGSAQAVGRADASLTDPVAQYRQGVAALGVKDYTKAAHSFGRVLKAAGKDANTNYLMGVTQIGLTQYNKAIKYFSKAIKYDPDLFAAHSGLAKAYMHSGQPDKAARVLNNLEARLHSCGENCSQRAGLIKCRDDVKALISSEHN